MATDAGLAQASIQEAACRGISRVTALDVLTCAPLTRPVECSTGVAACGSAGVLAADNVAHTAGCGLAPALRRLASAGTDWH